MRRALAALLFLALASTLAAAQVSGVVYNDRNGNGLRDAGEEGLSAVTVHIYGRPDAGGAVDSSTLTLGDGSFSLAPGNGCYVLQLDDPPGWRRTLARTDTRVQGAPGYVAPAGLRRFGGDLLLLSNLRGGALRYTSMGDSIAWNWNSCFDTSSFWYSKQIQSRLQCVAPTAAISLDQAAVKGSHTDDLLVDSTSSLNNVFNVLRANPKPTLVTISIIGNDLLDDEPPANPTQAQINAVAAEMLDSRSNLQEILSSLVAGLPAADVELNTLYDNLAYNCATNTFHKQWLPIVALILRDVAWGQARRVANAEVYDEFAKQDLTGACTGFKSQICQGIADGIHPTSNGYKTIREKVWESLDGVNLGPKDGNAATTIPGADHGYLRRSLHLLPTGWQALNGAIVTNPESAFHDDDGGAGAAVRLGIGTEEVRFTGFPDWFDEVTPVKVVAGVRYKTTGTVTDDFYRVEASVSSLFRPPPGHAYTATDWNYYTPMVGSGGPNMPQEAPDYPALPVLVVPNVADYRTVTAQLTKNPVVSADGHDYDDPPPTTADLGTSQIRVAAAPVAGTAGDNYEVVVDAAWLDVYGTIKPRPGEVLNLKVSRNPDASLTLAFDLLGGSELYNVYAGDLPTLETQRVYNYGADAWCNVTTAPAGSGRLQTTIAPSQVPAGSSYFLVTGRVSGVESPTGNASSGVERDRSQNRCP